MRIVHYVQVFVLAYLTMALGGGDLSAQVFIAKEKMVTDADVVAFVDISNVRNYVQGNVIGEKPLFQKQIAQATVKTRLKGEPPEEIIVEITETSDAPQFLNFEDGLYLVFLRKTPSHTYEPTRGFPIRRVSKESTVPWYSEGEVGTYPLASIDAVTREFPRSDK